MNVDETNIQRKMCKGTNCRRIKLLNISTTRLWSVAEFWYQGIKGHAETTGIEWNEAKTKDPNPGRPITK